MELHLLRWLLKNINYHWLIVILLIIISAISVCYVAQCNRHAYDQLQQVYQKRNEIKVEWSQLLLQYGTLTTYERIEQLAAQLGMQVPDQKNIILVKP